MHKFCSTILMAFCLLTGCSKPKTPAPISNAGSPASDSAAVERPSASAGLVEISDSNNDPVQRKLVELAGGGAKNCGLLKSVVPEDLVTASNCAESAFKARSPFYVEYEMPGLTVAVAGNAQGKFYSVQAGEGGKGMTSEECPAQLRVASSGRVTCYAKGTSPMGPGANPGSNPHGSAGAMPLGHPIPR